MPTALPRNFNISNLPAQRVIGSPGHRAVLRFVLIHAHQRLLSVLPTDERTATPNVPKASPATSRLPSADTCLRLKVSDLRKLSELFRPLTC